MRPLFRLLASATSCVLLAAGAVRAQEPRQRGVPASEADRLTETKSESAGANPAWIPWPRQVELLGGTRALAEDARVMARDADLLPLAVVLAEEIRRATGISLASAGGDASAGDVVLAFDRALPGDAYRLTVGDAIAVEGADYASCASGTVSLLQAIEVAGGALALPRCRVEDRPEHPYRALMIDCARQPQSIDTLQQVVGLCRFYKVRWLQLHLTDDQAFTFPSRAFPQLTTPGRGYTRADLEALERFARERGVGIVPELDVPGHSSAAVKAMPERFALAAADRNGGVLNMGREAAYEALDVLVGEMCEVFASSPWFHIGGDEVWLAHVAEDPDVQRYLRAHALPDVHELYRHFLVRMHEIVKGHGRRTLCWEGFGPRGEVEVPRDVTVLAWEAAYFPPGALLAAGYPVVNASWQPLYVVGGGARPPHAAPKAWSAEHLLGWHVRRWEHFSPRYPTFEPFEAATDAAVLGAQMCVWEQHEQSVVPSLVDRLGAFGECSWRAATDDGPATGWSEFRSRLDACRERVLRTVAPLRVSPAADALAPALEFERALTVTIESSLPGDVHYTLDGREPTRGDPRYEAPLVLERSASLRARLFEPGAPHATGGSAWQRYSEAGPVRVRFRRYESPRAGFAELPDFDALTPAATGTQRRLEAAPSSLPCGLVLEATLEIPADGEYELVLESCDGIAALRLDGKLVATQLERGRWEGASTTMRLAAGPHALRVDHAQGCFNALCRVLYRTPEMQRAQPVDLLLRPIDSR